MALARRRAALETAAEELAEEELAAPKTAAPLARLTRPGDSAGALWAHRLAVLVSARKAADATTRGPLRWAVAAAAVQPARGGPARAS
ncbi:MAG: hypothetical protein WAL59_20905, partial [Roseiarcus sp.]